MGMLAKKKAEKKEVKMVETKVHKTVQMMAEMKVNLKVVKKDALVY